MHEYRFQEYFIESLSSKPLRLVTLFYIKNTLKNKVIVI